MDSRPAPTVSSTRLLKSANYYEYTTCIFYKHAETYASAYV